MSLFGGDGSSPWATGSRMAGGVTKGSTPQERAAAGIARREAQRAKSRRQRCAKASGACKRAVAGARIALDRAYAAARSVDDADRESDEMMVLDGALALVVRAHDRCARALRACVAKARRADAPACETAAAAAERERAVAVAQCRRVEQAARKIAELQDGA